MANEPHYEYAITYRLAGQAQSKMPRTLINQGRDIKDCLKEYNEMIGLTGLYTDVGIQMRQISEWSDVDPESLWKE